MALIVAPSGMLARFLKEVGSLMNFTFSLSCVPNSVKFWEASKINRSFVSVTLIAAN